MRGKDWLTGNESGAQEPAGPRQKTSMDRNES